MGALLDGMRLEADGRLAVLAVDNDDDARRPVPRVDDLDGLINLPLQVRQIEAVVMFKETADGALRVSARSKGDIDVRAVAATLRRRRAQERGRVRRARARRGGARRGRRTRWRRPSAAVARPAGREPTPAAAAADFAARDPST